MFGKQSFLGLVAFVRKFIPNCSELIAPLTALLKKGVKFEWNFEREKNFEELKKRLTSAPLLQYPDPQKPYQLETDASDLAIGAVLRILTSEGYKPVAYKSRELTKSEQNYPIQDKKLFAIVHNFKKWRCYLEGIKHLIILRTTKP